MDLTCSLCPDPFDDNPDERYETDCCKRTFHKSCIAKNVLNGISNDCRYCGTTLSESDLENLNDPCIVCLEKTWQFRRKICETCNNSLDQIIQFFKPETSADEYSYLFRPQENIFRFTAEGKDYKSKFLELLEWNCSWFFDFSHTIIHFLAGEPRFLKFFGILAETHASIQEDRSYMEITGDFARLNHYKYLPRISIRCQRGELDQERKTYRETIETYGSLFATKYNGCSKRFDYDSWFSFLSTKLILTQFEKDMVCRILFPILEKINVEKLTRYHPKLWIGMKMFKIRKGGIKACELKTRVSRLSKMCEPAEEIEPECFERLFGSEKRIQESRAIGPTTML